MVLAIFETEANRSQQRAVSKACALARQILAIAAMYNDDPDLSELPRLELGVGIAFQPSAPTYWVDSDSRIMISRALNLSDRLSSCSKLARRLLGDKVSLFRLFVFQPGLQGAEEDEIDEFLIRFNLNGVELNDEGFAKLSEEIALHSVEAECEMPWGRELTTFLLWRSAHRRRRRTHPAAPGRCAADPLGRHHRPARPSHILRSLHASQSIRDDRGPAFRHVQTG